jgi:hypothetical protein
MALDSPGRVVTRQGADSIATGGGGHHRPGQALVGLSDLYAMGPERVGSTGGDARGPGVDRDASKPAP